MSTGRGWQSCKNLNNDDKWSNGIFCEVESGGFVAYLISADDLDIQHPFARVWIRRFVDSDNNSVAVMENEGYGTYSQDFLIAVEDWINSKQGKIPLKNYQLKGDYYSDSFLREDGPWYESNDKAVNEIQMNVFDISKASKNELFQIIKNNFYISALFDDNDNTILFLKKDHALNYNNIYKKKYNYEDEYYVNPFIVITNLIVNFGNELNDHDYKQIVQIINDYNIFSIYNDPFVFKAIQSRLDSGIIELFDDNYKYSIFRNLSRLSQSKYLNKLTNYILNKDNIDDGDLINDFVFKYSKLYKNISHDLVYKINKTVSMNNYRYWFLKDNFHKIGEEDIINILDDIVKKSDKEELYSLYDVFYKLGFKSKKYIPVLEDVFTEELEKYNKEYIEVNSIDDSYEYKEEDIEQLKHKKEGLLKFKKFIENIKG
jgi:hypothetical protein